MAKLWYGVDLVENDRDVYQGFTELWTNMWILDRLLNYTSRLVFERFQTYDVIEINKYNCANVLT